MVTSILKIIGSALEIAGNWIKVKSDPTTRKGNLELDVIGDYRKALEIAEEYIRLNHDFMVEIGKNTSKLGKKRGKLVDDFIKKLYKLENKFFKHD